MLELGAAQRKNNVKEGKKKVVGEEAKDKQDIFYERGRKLK